ncbi:MAG: hypothetical protein LBB94_01010, partial [Clostridiales bacterium]|nr:hypothetical protein [Clostridiales bacterium]
MGQDQGVYQTKAFLLINGINKNKFEIKEFQYLKTAGDKDSLSQYFNKQGAGMGFYTLANNANRGTLTSNSNDMPTDGIFHGIPNSPALLSVSGKIFGVSGMAHIQTLFFVISIILLYMILWKNLHLSKLTCVTITLLFTISPIILWVSKSALTEMGLACIIIAFMYFMTCEEPYARKLLWLPIAAFSFYHVSIYTLMPLFACLFVLLYFQYQKKLYLVNGIMTIVLYNLGFLSMAYSSPQYTFDNYSPLVNIMGARTDMSGVYPIIAVSSLTYLISILIILLLPRLSQVVYEFIRRCFRLLLRTSTVTCLVICCIRWFNYSFVIPKESDRWIYFKGNGLFISFQNMTLAAFAWATGILLLIIIIKAILSGKGQNGDKKIYENASLFFLTIMWIYMVLFNSALFRPDIPYYYYY